MKKDTVHHNTEGISGLKFAASARERVRPFGDVMAKSMRSDLAAG